MLRRSIHPLLDVAPSIHSDGDAKLLGSGLQDGIPPDEVARPVDDTETWDGMNAKQLLMAAKAAGAHNREDKLESETQKHVENGLRTRLKKFGWQDYQIDEMLDPQGMKRRAAEEAERDREAAELEAKMRKRLAQFGFSENQIKAMIYPETQ